MAQHFSRRDFAAEQQRIQRLEDEQSRLFEREARRPVLDDSFAADQRRGHTQQPFVPPVAQPVVVFAPQRAAAFDLDLLLPQSESARQVLLDQTRAAIGRMQPPNDVASAVAPATSEAPAPLSAQAA
jgi:hypothetical protein